MAANHAPEINHEDDAMWRRIRRVNCDHTVPSSRVDKSLKPELRDPARGGPAVLAWAVRGCLDWQTDGLGIPPVIEQATQDYREEMDPLADFIEDCCVLYPSAWVVSADLWDAYESWGRDNGERRLLSRKALGQQLRDRGCEDARQYVNGRQQRCWLGIGLADDSPNQPPEDQQDVRHNRDARFSNLHTDTISKINNTEQASISVLSSPGNDDQPYKNTDPHDGHDSKWVPCSRTSCEVCGRGDVMMREVATGLARHPRCEPEVVR
jgi:phage/plasmid-associated DNA primase